MLENSINMRRRYQRMLGIKPVLLHALRYCKMESSVSYRIPWGNIKLDTSFCLMCIKHLMPIVYQIKHQKRSHMKRIKNIYV